MKTILFAGVAAAALASASMADVTYTMTNQTWTGFNFNEAYTAGSLTGTLTGASVNVTLNAAVGFTYANVKVRRYGDCAIVSGDVIIDTKSRLDLRFTNVWSKAGGQWRNVHWSSVKRAA